MRYTIAERELLDGISARNAAAARSLARDRAYADAYYDTPAPTLIPHPPIEIRSVVCDFDERGCVRTSSVTSNDIAAGRRARHERWVYPQRHEAWPGFVYTRISTWGGWRELEAVEVKEYSRRYRLWCLRHGAGPRHPVMEHDRRAIEAVIGTELPRPSWYGRLLRLA